MLLSKTSQQRCDLKQVARLTQNLVLTQLEMMFAVFMFASDADQWCFVIK